MEQGILFDDMPEYDPNIKGIGARLFLMFNKKNPPKVSLYNIVIERAFDVGHTIGNYKLSYL